LLPPPPYIRQPFCRRLRARALPETEQRRQHLSQVGEGVDPQVLASPHHAVQRGRCPASLRTAAELPVAAAHDYLAPPPRGLTSAPRRPAAARGRYRPHG